MTPRARADAPISHAAGLTSDSAAAELICARHTWLTRTDFATRYIHVGTRPGQHPYAYSGSMIRARPSSSVAKSYHILAY